MKRIAIDEKILDDTMTAIGRFMNKACTNTVVFTDGNVGLVGHFAKIHAQISNAITEFKEADAKLFALQHACMDGVDMEGTP